MTVVVVDEAVQLATQRSPWAKLRANAWWIWVAALGMILLFAALGPWITPFDHDQQFVRANLRLLQGFDAGPLTAPESASGPPGNHPRYRFERFLARGGMGEVWRGTDTLLGRDVALKVIRRRPFAGDGVPRFREEARLVSRLEHPGIVPVYDLGELPDGRPFFVMKLIEGRTLAELLREQAQVAGHDRDRWLQKMRVALGIGTAIMLVIGVVGGYLVSRFMLHRLDVINRTTARIMAGDFSRRIQVSDTNDEFDELGRNVNLMLDRIDHLLRSMRQVTDDIAHDRHPA